VHAADKEQRFPLLKLEQGKLNEFALLIQARLWTSRKTPPLQPLPAR
jgi:hypothetical protein